MLLWLFGIKLTKKNSPSGKVMVMKVVRWYEETEENASLNSTSITMNSTKDNLLDVSITSNPTIDEKSAIENSMLTDVAYTNSRPLSPPHDLPPPPPDLAKPTTSSSSVLSHAASESQHQLISGTPASKSSINNGSTSSQSLLSQGTQKPQPSSSTSSYSGKTSTPKLARSGTLLDRLAVQIKVICWCFYYAVYVRFRSQWSIMDLGFTL
ncbi:hypothetical protein Y032_0612g669 [Ancylostoma ceylanicum]|uniref:Uncharacterized protein n=1 Tax=Ancylostoma ceylanicum TaxID=53326 RepID=A0A016WMG1_9BILA|nr:hypothetical protein Y032_0612g669 [Ancylostoma ceylanicum]